MQDVLLAFGSNLGDRQKILENAWSAIVLLPGVETIRISRFHTTKAVGGPKGQPDFLNAAGLLRTRLEAQELLEKLQEIESRFGRIRREHWGPRTLDIDILLFGDRIIETPMLVVPHREMLHRDFVLLPALEVAPNMIHPIANKTIQAIVDLKSSR